MAKTTFLKTETVVVEKVDTDKLSEFIISEAQDIGGCFLSSLNFRIEVSVEEESNYWGSPLEVVKCTVYRNDEELETDTLEMTIFKEDEIQSAYEFVKMILFHLLPVVNERDE